MDVALLFKALVLGVVEGLTEFLPISSTGHLIVVADLLDVNDDKGKLFNIVIQSGAILAVVWEYRLKMWRVLTDIPNSPQARRFALAITIAFCPLAILGLVWGKPIKAYLFNPLFVATTSITGALLIFWAERRHHQVRVHSVDEVSTLDAVKLGLAQALALLPGMSRSGATIIGGLFFGLSRRAATEFSFFLAIPTLGCATVYQLIKERAMLSSADIPVFAVGFVAAFISAFLAVRALLRFISTHDFTVFAWYRILFGTMVLATWKLGIVNWG